MKGYLPEVASIDKPPEPSIWVLRESSIFKVNPWQTKVIKKAAA